MSIVSWIHRICVIARDINSVIVAYRDESESKYFMSDSNVGADLSNPGFKTIYKRKEGGRRFTELLDKVSMIDPEVMSNLSVYQCATTNCSSLDAYPIYIASS